MFSSEPAQRTYHQSYVPTPLSCAQTYDAESVRTGIAFLSEPILKAHGIEQVVCHMPRASWLALLWDLLSDRTDRVTQGDATLEDNQAMQYLHVYRRQCMSTPRCAVAETHGFSKGY